jgi:hypothetical protein
MFELFGLMVLCVIAVAAFLIFALVIGLLKLVIGLALLPFYVLFKVFKGLMLVIFGVLFAIVLGPLIFGFLVVVALPLLVLAGLFWAGKLLFAAA